MPELYSSSSLFNHNWVPSLEANAPIIQLRRNRNMMALNAASISLNFIISLDLVGFKFYPLFIGS